MKTLKRLQILRGGMGLILVPALLAACTPRDPGPSAPVDIKGTSPNQALDRTGTNTLNNSVIQGADQNGIITYDGYQTIVARDGDTVGSVAERIEISGTELGGYNGLPTTHRLQAGDELVLPPRPGGYGDAGPRASVIAPANPSATAQAPVQSPSVAATPIQQSPLGTEVNPDGTLVAATSTVASDATSTEVTTGAEAPQQRSSTWSPDLAAAAIARSRGLNSDGSLGAPPSSATPVPAEPAAKPELQSPDLRQYQTEESVNPNPLPSDAPGLDDAQDLAAADPSATVLKIKMQKPVEGPVAIGFNKGSGPARNDGVDFAAPAGAPVVAAADGEVALVSQSLGGLGTILLVRHANELLTVYGRIDGVLVNKGDIVAKGQQIGIVSNATAPAEPRMHFEVRRGSESLDPMLFL